MKNLKLITAALFATSFLLGISSNAAFASVKEYKTESNHTSVLWVANHLGFSDVSGKFTDVAGKISFDEENPKNSSVSVTIQIDSLNTGLKKFDEHLKSADFFDAKKFSTAKFTSKKITVTGKNTAKIEGDLTLHGITKTVVLDTVLNKIAENPFSKTPTIGFSAKTKINRSDFDMKYALPHVADQIDLTIQVEANPV